MQAAIATDFCKPLFMVPEGGTEWKKWTVLDHVKFRGWGFGLPALKG